MNHPKITTAMLFAAGLGSRLKPFTDHHPKALSLVNQKTLLQHNLEYLKKYGFEKVIVNVHHFASQIIDFIDKNNFGMEIIISDEQDEVLETGGGLVKAKKHLQDLPFLVMNVDILTDLDLQQLIDFYHQNQVLGVLAVSDRNSSRKLFFNQNNKLVGWKNFSNNETIGNTDDLALAFSGIHVLSPEIFDLIAETGKFSIMKTYMNLMEKHSFLGFNHSGGKLIDVGKPESIQEAELLFS
jgi:N-acetyl-alpha-D-muramate 1-phosphate uridylyltransferase